MLLKNILASKSDKKVTITNGEMRKLIGTKYSKDEVTVYYHGLVPITFKSTRRGTTWYAKQILPNYCEMPQVGKPVYFQMTLKSIDSSNKLQQGLVGSKWSQVELKDVSKKPKKTTKLNNESALSEKYEYFTLIRKWADDRGLYDKGDAKTQFLKLQEETGELAKALLKDDRNEIIDAIGDIVVVLTNLTQLTGIFVEEKGNVTRLRNIKIEDCIETAYNVIKLRSGSMKNGTFVKNEK
jgi:phosphoribosyl-ATP pyrophosphohydrolase